MAKVMNGDRFQTLIDQSRKRQSAKQAENEKASLLKMISELSNGCWDWLGGKNRKGYGRLSYKGKLHQAHRVFYEVFIGAPGELHVLHRCNNPSCVNPEHLYLGTNQQNVDDREAAGRGIYRKGYRPINAKIAPEIVLAIKEQLQCRWISGLTLNEIASNFNVSNQAVRDISCGRTYTNLDKIPLNMDDCLLSD